jgi:Alpha/beta hydrolase of unknown function (DUF900)
MRVSGHFLRSVRTLQSAWIVGISLIAGCYSPQTRNFDSGIPVSVAATESSSSAQIATAPVAVAIVPPPRGSDGSRPDVPPSAVETWVVHTRACEQKLGSDPWSSINIARIDEWGGPLHGSEPDALLARMTGRPSVFFIHGNGYTFRSAVDEAVKIRAVLETNGGLPPESLFIVFDWPSEGESTDLIVDLNEQARRSRVAAYHFARFLQSSPPGSRICLMGNSNGGRIVLTTAHLLAGATLQPFWSEPAVHLSSGRPDLRLRAVVLDAAAGHHWLNPGERLDQALPMCESLLNLRNCADYALSIYIFGVYTGLRPALGQVGLLAGDLRRLGPLSARVEQINMHAMVGFSHTAFPQALDIPSIAERIARYTSWSEVSLPAGVSR